MTKESREFHVQLVSWKEVHELPDCWTSQRLLTLLDSLEVGGVSETEAEDMALMALQDLDPGEASERVLEAVFGEMMRPGVRKNLAHDLTEERPWEEFADISQQAGIFNAVVLLQQAFPRDFDRPDAVSVTVRLETASERGNAWLDTPQPAPALLLRIMAAGMDESATLHRLFGESLAGRSFAEADGILWHVGRNPAVLPAHELSLFSSHQWFDPLKGRRDWTAEAWIDAPVVPAGE